MRLGIGALAAGLLAASASPHATASSQVPAPTAPTAYLDFIVKDLRGRPVLDLQASEVIIFDKNVRQRVTALRAQGTPGRYEAAYQPSSGYASQVSVRVARPGARILAPDGREIKIRVVEPVLPMEVELARLLEEVPNSDDIPLHASVLRLEEGPEEGQYALGVEVSLPGLVFGRKEEKFELLVRIKNAQGEIVQRERAVRALVQEADAQSPVQRLVWTGQARLRPGRYTLQAIVRDVARRVSVRMVSFEAKASAAGLRLSSVALLLNGGAQPFEDRDRVDDPFYVDGQSLMLAFSPTLPAAPGAKVEFSALAYPDPANSAPLEAQAELLRNGEVVASQPVSLASIDKRGARRCTGSLAIAKLRPGEYQLRLVTRQGEATAQGQTAFAVEKAIRVPRPTWPTLQRAELAELKGLLGSVGAEETIIARLRRIDEADGKGDPEVLFLLSQQYCQVKAYADAEKAARRAAELTKDPTALGMIQTILGRALTEGEKQPINPGSERLRAAEAAFRAAMAIEGTPDSVWLSLARTLIRLEREAEAQAVLSELLERPELDESLAAEARQLARSPRCATQSCLPQFSFVSSEGEHLRSESLNGKVVLLLFWSPFAPPGEAALPDLQKLITRNAGEPFAVVSIGQQYYRGNIEQLLAKYKIQWPQLSSAEGSRVTGLLGITLVPTEVLFDHNGVRLGAARRFGGDWTHGALMGHVRKAIQDAKLAATSGAGASSK